MLLEKLVVRHEYQGIVGDGNPLPVGMAKARRKLRERRWLVRLEQSLVDAGGERFYGAAEQHIDTGVILFGDHPGERLARREAHKVDLDAGRFLELLEHRPRPILRPDRVDVERVR